MLCGELNQSFTRRVNSKKFDSYSEGVDEFMCCFMVFCHHLLLGVCVCGCMCINEVAHFNNSDMHRLCKKSCHYRAAVPKVP